MHNGPRSMPPGRTSSISDRFNEKFCQLFWVSHFFVSGLAHSWSMAVLFNYTVRSVMICHSLNLGVLFSQHRVGARKKKESNINPLKDKRLRLVHVTCSTILLGRCLQGEGGKKKLEVKTMGIFQKPWPAVNVFQLTEMNWDSNLCFEIAFYINIPTIIIINSYLPCMWLTLPRFSENSE